MRGLFTFTMICLGLGLWLIFKFCQGTIGFSFGLPLSATKLQMNFTTTGAPALWGLILTLLGVFLLIVTWIIALVRPAGQREIVAVREVIHREKPSDL